MLHTPEKIQHVKGMCSNKINSLDFEGFNSRYNYENNLIIQCTLIKFYLSKVKTKFYS